MAIDVNLTGHKELLGLWLGQSEGAKFWLGCLRIRHWKQALNHFAILYEGRMPEHVSK